MSDYGKILEFIDTLQIIDTHEHLPMEAQRDPKGDLFTEWLVQYFVCDLLSAGLSEEALAQVRDPGRDLMERWTLLEPYWDAARSTGYGRALDLAAKGVYGIDGVSRRTVGPLNEAFKAARDKGGHYRTVLKEKSRIALSLVDSDLACDREFFASVIRPEEFVLPTHLKDLRAAGAKVGLRVHRLDDWEEAMRLTLERALDEGAVAIKLGLAYQRTLQFDKADRADAEREFNVLFEPAHTPDWRGGVKVGPAFQDYMVHAILRLADQRGLVVQIHTGIQEGTGNVMSDARPSLLSNLLLEYRNVRFDLFHMGYPWLLELGVLAKNFPSVHIDMCWGHIVSPEAARRGLTEWLDTVPANKISAFGGDFGFVDGVYGHQLLARQNVAASLAAKVAGGSMGLDRAKQVAQWMFVDNPTRLFGLADCLKAAAAAKPGAKKGPRIKLRPTPVT
jgi:hypothetical protein